MIKPYPGKNYGSIPHCSQSKLGSSDRICNPGQEKIATQKCRDGDTVFVQEKLDGSNCGVFKQSDNQLVAISRSGNRCDDSRWLQHRYFNIWMHTNYDRFDAVLQPGERLVGEWLALCHGTRYDLPHEPFVVFDIFDSNNRRLRYDDLIARTISAEFILPRLIHRGSAISIEQCKSNLQPSGHGAIDPVEGCVWRVETESKVDFLIKYVRSDYQPGKYLSNEIWYWYP